MTYEEICIKRIRTIVDGLYTPSTDKVALIKQALQHYDEDSSEERKEK